MQTYNTYIPGPYENFAEQATEDTRKGKAELRIGCADAREERAESGGNSVGQGRQTES